MGKLQALVNRMPRRVSAVIAIIAAAIIIPATLQAWGPNRETFTEAHPAPYVTFNSITDNSFYGDERNFVTIKDASNTNDGGWTDTVNVQPGKEYVVRMYVHNNAADHLKLVAENVRASASVPTTTAKSVPISGFVSASNAKPASVHDDVTLTANQDFNLAYIPGSASFHNNSIGKGTNGVKLNDSIVTSTGALLGYDKLDGKIPGCYKYSGYVYFKVKPQFAQKNTFEMNKQVRKAGESTWKESVATKPGDTVEYQISYKNTGETRQNNVTVKDTLPAGLTYVNGSTYLKNGTNPNGLKVSDNLTTSTGINIGDYNAQAAAYIKFSAKVNANDTLPKCGPNTLTNKATVIVDGGAKEDTADVTVPKECQPTPQPEYKCDSLTVTKISRTQFSFDTKYTVKDAVYKSTTYIIRDASGKEISRSTNKTFTSDKVGKYTVEAIVTVTVNGTNKTVTSENCKKEFEVTPIPVTPAYACESLTATKISRTEYSFAGKAAATGGATIVSYTFDFGDGNTETIANPTVTHTYSQAKVYTVKMSVTVKIDGSNKTVTSDACKTQITISPEKPEECKPGIPVGDPRCEEKPPVEECKPGVPVGDERCTEKCEIPGKEHLPKDSPDCKETPVTPETPETPQTPETPAELPKTGVADTILTLMGVGSLIAAASYYIASRRALG
jgi:uncharacterized repeat protein (TIGR01451 family)/LPXTG-motif cell wall-anchored protein